WQGNRRIVHRGDQRVGLRLLQRRQKYRWLDQRPNGPGGIQRPVEAGKAWIATANQGENFPGLRAGDDHGRLRLRASPLPEPLEAVGYRLFRLQLQQRIEAGKDPQAFAGQILILVVLAQLTLD